MHRAAAGLLSLGRIGRGLGPQLCTLLLAMSGRWVPAAFSLRSLGFASGSLAPVWISMRAGQVQSRVKKRGGQGKKAKVIFLWGAQSLWQLAARSSPLLGTGTAESWIRWYNVEVLGGA